MIQALTEPLQQSRAAFVRSLPQLLTDAQHVGWWAAFCGEQCLGVSNSPQELLQEIQRRGLAVDSCYLGVIRQHEPEPEEIQPRPAHHFASDESES